MIGCMPFVSSSMRDCGAGGASAIATEPDTQRIAAIPFQDLLFFNVLSLIRQSRPLADYISGAAGAPQAPWVSRR
jgi:hypothetical protein